jgi:hypothetical protein
MILRAMPAVFLPLEWPSMLDRSKVMTQTKRDNLILQVAGWGIRLTSSPHKKNFTVDKPVNGHQMAKTGARVGTTYKDYDFYIDTWNVLGLYTAGKLEQVKTELEKYRTEIAKNQKTRWKGMGVVDTRILH